MKKSLFIILSFVTLFGCVSCVRTQARSNTSPQPSDSITYVPTQQDVVKDMLWLAEVGPNDVVYDLGSGDGRVVIAAVRDFHAKRAVGVEIEAELVEESRANAVAAGVQDRVEFIHGNLFKTDFSEASVVVLYLGHEANLALRARIFRTLKPGSRVVSNKFGMGEWKRDKRLDVRRPVPGMLEAEARWLMPNVFRTNPAVPDFDDSASPNTHYELSEWVVPAPVAGIWRGKVRTESGEGELKLILRQNLSIVRGSFELKGPTNLAGSVRADLWGNHLICPLLPERPADKFDNEMDLDGCVRGDSLSGTLWLNSEKKQVEWLAQREKADFTGIWEWPSASGAPVQLKIERRDGKLVAMYTDVSRDNAQPIPVPDIYDFGGGFYFTLLLGLEGERSNRVYRKQSPQESWLVGEAMMNGSALEGRLHSYPYAEATESTSKPAPKLQSREWKPKRVDNEAKK
ncbi:MAG TPA: hypothetical protein DET40_25255 [Lentisphaeria bacterium]|nr:MAG: hypothetical protein A2X45_18710 [Lentisphaerae bacterium GWF2_50_93]HCE46869.1 hypothetical protein [Lentisphaeria bacterium]